MVLLLLTCCLLLLPLLESVIVLRFAVHSSFAIILMGKRELVALLNVFLVSRDCCMALPRGAIGLSAVCDCGIS